MKPGFVCSLFVVVCFPFVGCQEFEPDNILCECMTSGHALEYDDLTGDWKMSEEEVLQQECQRYTKELEGQWDGLGMTQSNRFILYPGGEYDFFTRMEETWHHSSSGRYWVRMTLYRGTYRTELHMSWPDNDDYPIRFHFEGNVLHLEEPTDGGEPEMRYLHVKDKADFEL